jgi:hypothetical protein
MIQNNLDWLKAMQNETINITAVSANLDEIATSALIIFGTNGLYHQLERLADQLDNIAANIKTATDWKVDTECQRARDASVNMLKSALAVISEKEHKNVKL